MKKHPLQSTSERGVYRYKRGKYYCRFKVGSKATWCKAGPNAENFASAVEFCRALKRDARRAAAATKQQRQAAGTDTKKPEVFSAWAERYTQTLAERVAGQQITEKTRLYYIDRLRSIELHGPSIWTARVRLLDRQIIENYLSSRATAGASRDARRGDLLAIRGVCELAVRLGWCSTNPAAGIRGPGTSTKPHNRFEITPEMFESLLAHMGKRWLLKRYKSGDVKELVPYEAGRRAALAAALAAALGCRWGELQRITWSDVDFEKRVVTIHGGKGRIARGGSAIRVFPFYPRLVAVLEQLRPLHKSPDDPVAPAKTARLMMQRAAVALGWPAELHHITHHDLRHLAATWMLSSGLSVPIVAALLGHKDGGGLLLRTYTHPHADTMRTELQKMG